MVIETLLEGTNRAAPPPRARAGRARTAKIALVVMKSIFVLLFVLGALFPLAWLVISGFKSRTEVVRTPFQFLPEVWRWENYAQILSDPAFLQAIFISMVGAVIFAALSLIVNSLAALRVRPVGVQVQAHPVGHRHRHDAPARDVDPADLVHRRFPAGDARHAVGADPAGRGLRGADLLPAAVLLVVPRALEESATIDGAGRFRIFLSIFVPMSKPVFVVVAMTSFLAFWNSYVWPVMTISSPNLMQIQQYLALFRAERLSELGLLMAGSALAAAPVIILCLLLQRYLVEGSRSRV